MCPHLRRAAVAVALAVTIPACGDDDDTPTDPSLDAEILDALCAQAERVADGELGPGDTVVDGTVYLAVGGERYNMSDCP